MSNLASTCFTKQDLKEIKSRRQRVCHKNYILYLPVKPLSWTSSRGDKGGLGTTSLGFSPMLLSYLFSCYYAHHCNSTGAGWRHSGGLTDLTVAAAYENFNGFRRPNCRPVLALLPSSERGFRLPLRFWPAFSERVLRSFGNMLFSRVGTAVWEAGCTLRNE